MNKVTVIQKIRSASDQPIRGIRTVSVDRALAVTGDAGQCDAAGQVTPQSQRVAAASVPAGTPPRTARREHVAYRYARLDSARERPEPRPHFRNSSSG